MNKLYIRIVILLITLFGFFPKVNAAEILQVSSSSVLLIGDVSFLHDIGGLLAIDHEYQITIVINNNSGGGIFSFLQISNSGIKKFDKFWTTNRNIYIKKIAELYNCHHYPINNLLSFILINAR